MQPHDEREQPPAAASAAAAAPPPPPGAGDVDEDAAEAFIGEHGAEGFEGEVLDDLEQRPRRVSVIPADVATVKRYIETHCEASAA